MSNAHQLVVGGIYFGNLETAGVTQSYEPVEGDVGYLRMADRSLVAQCFGDAKLRTRISAPGWIPSGLSALARGVEYTLKCLAPWAVQGASVSLTLPSYRSDVAVTYEAWVADALVTWNGVDPIGGAQAYRAICVPQIQAYLIERAVDVQIYPGVYGWRLTFEEA